MTAADDQALQDWGSRISVESLARLRAHDADNYAYHETRSPELLDLASNAAMIGAALALECMVRIGALDMAAVDRLVKETP